MKVPTLVILPFLLLLALAAGPAQEPFPPFGGSDQVTGEAFADLEQVPAGESFRVALTLVIPPGWHLYGNPVGPGSGKPTLVHPRPVEGFTFGPTLYPPPEKLAQPESGPEAWVWAYEFQIRLYLQVETAPTLAPGTHDLSFDLDALACKEACLPITFPMPLQVRVAPPGTERVAANAAEFEGFDRARPAPEQESKPEEKPEKEVKPAGGDQGTEPLDEAQAERFIARFEVRQGEDEIGSLWLAILFGFIAGVILNVMPCVLPVISIKVLSFVQQAGEDRARVFRLGIAFAAGILVVFLVLAGLAAFAGQSWGEQFQSSTFLVIMIALVFAFSLAMFDLYTFELPGFVSQVGQQQREGYLGAFAKGMLATALATPCSGPFLGSTLAWVMGQPPAVIFTIFTSIGLGMAIPYVILTANPVFLKFVPKPGNWMVRFKELMGFVLLATVVYLLTIVPSNQVVWVVGFLLFVAVGAWIYGRVTGPWKPRLHRLVWRSVALVVIGLGGWLSLAVLLPLYTGAAGGGLGSEPFSLAGLKRHLEEGRSVMVDWTADWCPNCKFVEQTVLHTEAVEKKVEEKGVVFMIADITRPHHDAQALMKKLGSQSIPFLGIFPAGDPYRPWILRDIYSQSALLEILAQIR